MHICYDGYVGKNYDLDISIKEIAKRCRKYIKKNWPGCKVSITTNYNKINVDLVAAPFTPFNLFEIHNFSEYNKKDVIDGYMSINHYNIGDDERLSPQASEFFQDVKFFLANYNFVDQDIQTDFYRCHFYIDMAIGKWDKPFTKTN